MTVKTAMDSATIGPETECDQGHHQEQAGGVAGHARQRDPVAVGHGPADDEDHARPGDHDQDQRSNTEAEQLVDADHQSLVGSSAFFVLAAAGSS